MHHVYILHGWAVDPDNEKKWQPFIDKLKKEKIPVSFLKLPGLSTKLSGVWNIGDYLTWLHTQIPSGTKSVLIGHSFGGQLGIKYAALYPDEIAKLILIDSSGIRDHSVKTRIKRSVFMIIAKTGKLFSDSELFRKILYKLARESDYQKAPPILRKTMANVIKDEVHNDLSNITCPVLIIWGEHDKVTPLWIGELMNRTIPKSTIHLIKDARHSPQYTHPEETSKPIISFLRS